MSFWTRQSQDVVVSSGNCSTANLNALATFSGVIDSSMTVAAIQVNLKTDQNCIVYIDQAMDSVPNWDITDHYDYFAADGGNGWTVKATASNFRVRVQNLSTTAATTYFRLQTVTCPITEPSPRSLTDQGNFRTAVNEINGSFGTPVIVNPMGGLKVSTPTRLVGSSFTGTFDANFWIKTTQTGTSDATVAGRVLTLATNPTGSGSGNNVVVNSVRTARYSGGTNNFFRGVVRLPAVTGLNTRRFGAFNATDGFFFEHDGTNLKVVSRSGTSDTPVTSGSFNGEIGNTYLPGTSIKTYQIWWTNSKVWFMVDGYVLHTISSTTTPLTGTCHLPLGFQCLNGANINNNTLEVWTASINRSGLLLTQPSSARISTTTTTVLKYGPGNLHSMIFGNLPTTAGTVTVYDNTTSGGTVLWSAILTRAAGTSVPVSVDFKGLPFFTGLTIVTATNACDFNVVYE